MAVVVEEDRRIDPIDVAQPDRLRPRSRGVRRRDDEVAATTRARRDQVKRAVVVANRRRVNALGNAPPIQRELRRSVEYMTDLRPMDQVATLEDRNPREVREARGDEVVIVAGANDARIGIKAG